MANSDFYSDLDLSYPEIAINVEPIDRLNPGKCKFYIPVLMPYLSKDSAVNKTKQLNNSNMLNVKPNLFDVSKVEVANYVEIPVPPEMCTLPCCQMNCKDATHCFIKSKHHCIWGPTVSHTVESCIFDGESLRIIPANSKWVVVFIGGDITYPVIIAKIPT